MNRPGRVVFALAAVVAISALNFQPIEAQTRIMWAGETAVGFVELEGTLEGFPQEQFHIFNVRLDPATLTLKITTSPRRRSKSPTEALRSTSPLRRAS